MMKNSKCNLIVGNELKL